jgi:hypothetical protein
MVDDVVVGPTVEGGDVGVESTVDVAPAAAVGSGGELEQAPTARNSSGTTPRATRLLHTAP